MTNLVIPETADFFTSPTGKTLAYNFFGSPVASAPTIFYFHGYPASHHEALLFHPAALAAGIRLLAITRPGYGESTYDPDRTLLDWPKTVLALADHLGIERFGIIGVSGGGPFVFACLHAIPRERLLAAGIVCGLYPTELGLAGMGLKQRFLLNAVYWSPGLLTWLMRGQFDKIRTREAESGEAVEQFLDAEMASLPAVDHRVWETNEGGFREVMLAACRLMIRNSHAAEAMVQEAKLFARPWGFGLGELALEGRLVLWHGTEDVNVPFRMAVEAGKVLGEGVEVRVCEGEGHGSLAVRRAGEVLGRVVEMMKG